MLEDLRFVVFISRMRPLYLAVGEAMCVCVCVVDVYVSVCVWCMRYVVYEVWYVKYMVCEA